MITLKRKLVLIVALIVLLSTGTVFAQTLETEDNSNLSVSKMMLHNKHAHKANFITKNKELLDLLKMNAKDLTKELKSGKSLADVAKKQGVSEQEVTELLIKQANQRIDQAVADGKITVEQATLHKDMVQKKMKYFVEKKGLFTKDYRYRRNRLGDVANILKMSEKDIVIQLKEGKSITQIAKDKGMSKEKLIEELVKKDKEYITNWVDKSWKINKKK